MTPMVDHFRLCDSTGFGVKMPDDDDQEAEQSSKHVHKDIRVYTLRPFSDKG